MESLLEKIIKVNVEWIVNYRQTFKCSLRHSQKTGANAHCKTCEEIQQVIDVIAEHKALKEKEEKK